MSEPIDPAPPRRPSRPAPKGLDEYSEVLGMTPREHDRKMRKWYVLLAITGFFAVFGEGILMLSARRKERQEAAARAAQGAPVGGAETRSADSASAPPR